MKRKRRVRVHLEGAPSIEGILLGRWPRYKLTEARAIEAEDRHVPLEGDTKIERRRVLFYQEF